jgi:hypothetical protein
MAVSPLLFLPALCKVGERRKVAADLRKLLPLKQANLPLGARPGKNSQRVEYILLFVYAPTQQSKKRRI